MEYNHCYICYEFEDELFICDRCDNWYCYECSYSYTYHNPYEGNLCYLCSDQSRRKALTDNDIRNNKIKMCINE
jgi:hypothetical protein